MDNTSDLSKRLITALEKRLNNHNLELYWLIELTSEVKNAFPFVTLTRKVLPEVRIVIINDSTMINALSAVIDGELVMGIFTGLLLRIINVVKLMMGNDTDTVLNTATISNMQNEAEICFVDGLEVDYNWGDLDTTKVLWGEVLIELAFTFIAFHEIGHHKLNHFSQDSKVSDLSLYLDSDISDLEKEIAADVYATNLLSRNINMMSDKIFKTFNITQDESYNSSFEYTVMAIMTVIYLLYQGYENDYQTRGVRAITNVSSLCMQMFKCQTLKKTLSRDYITHMHGDTLCSLKPEDMSFEDYIVAWYDKNGCITNDGMVQFVNELHFIVLGNICSVLDVGNDTESIAKHIQVEHLDNWLSNND